MTTWPNWVDLIVLTIVLASCYNGFQRGIWVEILNLLCAVAVATLCVNYANWVTYRLRPGWLSLPLDWLTTGVFWACFVLLWLAARLAVGLLTRLIKWNRMSWVAQGIGMALGGLRGVWWSGFLLIVLAASDMPYLHDSVVTRSIAAGWLLDPARDTLEWASDHAPGAQYRVKGLVPPMPFHPHVKRRETHERAPHAAHS